MRPLLTVPFVLLITSTSVADPLSQAERFLEEHRLVDDVHATPPSFEAIRDVVQAG